MSFYCNWIHVTFDASCVKKCVIWDLGRVLADGSQNYFIFDNGLGGKNMDVSVEKFVLFLAYGFLLCGCPECLTHCVDP